MELPLRACDALLRSLERPPDSACSMEDYGQFKAKELMHQPRDRLGLRWFWLEWLEGFKGAMEPKVP